MTERGQCQVATKAGLLKETYTMSRIRVREGTHPASVGLGGCLEQFGTEEKRRRAKRVTVEDTAKTISPAAAVGNDSGKWCTCKKGECVKCSCVKKHRKCGPKCHGGAANSSCQNTHVEWPIT